MNLRLLAAARLLRRGLSVLATLVLLGLLTASFAAYLTVTGKSLLLLRTITGRLGTLVEGQRIEQLTLNVRAMPETARLAGSATLLVRSLEEGRQRFYFLLNSGLRLRDVRVGGVDAHVQMPAAYQLWLLTVVDVGSRVPKDATLQLTFDYEGTVAGDLFGSGVNAVSPQHILLGVDSFWYPADAHSFFTADVTVTVPSGMTVVQNGVQATRITRGDVQEVHWSSERPIGGLALVAGPYELTAKETAGITYRLYLPSNVQLDPFRILEAMAAANRTLEARYGPSGFRQVTMFVSRDVRRGFNDGAGVVGLSIRYFRVGDYGFGIIAHEIAHNWWGATVAEKWLSPGTGGEWIVEGFAEFSSLVAAEASYGAGALTRRLATEFFDPAHQKALSDMSVLDNGLTDATARDTIYRKGAYVAFMLRHVLGDEVYFRALRQFLERFRYQHATDRDLQQVLQDTTEHDLAAYFTDWVRSDKLADLSLDSASQAELTVSNLGPAVIPGSIALWKFKKSGGAPVRSTVQIGDRVPMESDTEYAVLDPLLEWADVQRQNNRYPRRNDPVYVATSTRGEVALTRGDALPWARTAVSYLDSSGRTRHTWDFNRGVAAPPVWSPDGARIIVSYATADAPLPAVVTLAAKGAQRTVGHGTAPAVGSDGTMYAAKGDRIIRLLADGSEASVIQRCGESLDAPLPAPDGRWLVYTSARANQQELRAVAEDGKNDRMLMAWDRDRLVYRWSPDATRLYAIVGGDWDWQILEIPLASEPPRTLARAAATITDLAVSPTGTALAFTATPSMDYPVNRQRLYVMDLGSRTVRQIDVPDADLSQLAWLGSDTLLVVATSSGGDPLWTLPATRALKRVRLADGSLEDVQ